MTHTALLGVYYSCSSELLVSGYSCGIRAKEVCLGLELRLFPFCKPVLAWPRIPFADKPLLPLIAHSLSPHLRLTLTLSLIIRTLGSPLTLTLAPCSFHRLSSYPNPSPVLHRLYPKPDSSRHLASTIIITLTLTLTLSPYP